MRLVIRRLAVVVVGFLIVGLSAPPAPTDAAQTVAARFELRVPVMYYHRIMCYPQGAPSRANYTCPDVLEAQLTTLRDAGWSTITADALADYLAARQCPPLRTMVVSFDDGRADNYDAAAPILERLGMRGTFFVNAGLAGQPTYMTFDQMRDLLARGHAIGNHALTHMSLPTASLVALHEQVEGAQVLLERELGFRPRTFAYPYGRYGYHTDRIVDEVRASGFELAFTVVRGARESTDAPLLSRRLRTPTLDTGPITTARLAPFVNSCQPPTADLAVAKASAGPYRGEDVYASYPRVSQTVERNGAVKGRSYDFWFRLGNDSNFADTFAIRPTITGPPAGVRFWVAGVDITDRMIAGTYTTSELKAWSSLAVRVTVPAGSALPGQRVEIVLRAYATTQPDLLDTAVLRLAF